MGRLRSPYFFLVEEKKTMENFPEGTVFTVLGKEPEMQELMKSVQPPRTRNRKQPFIVFLAEYKGDAIGNKPTRRAPLCYDLSKGDLSMVRRYVVDKKWAILCYNLTQAFIPQGAEHTWDNRPFLAHMRPEIEALANGNSQIIEKRNEEISALKARLEEYERGETETVAKRGRRKKEDLSAAVEPEERI